MGEAPFVIESQERLAEFVAFLVHTLKDERDE